jgi:hypothetical protein
VFGPSGSRRRTNGAFRRRPLRHARSARGFTIFELMNLLGLAGVLSAIGMVVMARYVRHEKTAEAVGSLNTLAQESASFYDGSDATQPVGSVPDAAHAMRHFPSGSTVTVPPSIDDVRAKKYQSAQADWATSPWHELGFSIPQPQYYLYSYASEGAGLTAKATVTAHGDLDGDRIQSTFSITVAPDTAYRARIGDMVKEDSDE